MQDSCPVDGSDSSCLLTPALEIAIDAGKRILEIYEGGFNVEQKDDLTPLTEADMASNAIIEQGLHQLTPHLPVLTEESEKIPFSERRQWLRYWTAPVNSSTAPANSR